MDETTIEIPRDSEGQPSFLLPQELVVYLEGTQAELEKNILNIVYDIEMPRKDLAAVINWQGQLAVVKELIEIHNSKLNSEA